MPTPESFWHRRPLGIVLFCMGVLLTVFACGLLTAHATSFGAKRDRAVMIGTTLPELRSSVALLAANAQAEQLFSQNALAAREEQASAYILPVGPAASRAIGALQEIAAAIALDDQQGSIGSILFDQAPVDSGAFKTIGAELHLRGNLHFVARFLSVLSFSGDLMVRDALTDDAADSFLKLVEAMAPLSLRTAEDFLYTDLLQYAAHPDQYEQDLLKDLSIDAAAEVRQFLLLSRLASVKNSLSSIAPSLVGKKVWPLPLLSVQTMTKNADVTTVGLRFYRR